LINRTTKILLFLIGVGLAASGLTVLALRQTPDPLYAIPTPVTLLKQPRQQMAASTVSRAASTVAPTFTPKSLAQPTAANRLTTVAGVVVDANGPVAGATVRIHLSADAHTTTAPDGSFKLTNLAASDRVTITAWAAGYYINWLPVQPDDGPIQLELHPYYTTDNVAYDWFEQDGIEGSAACGTCHTAYTEWQADAHAQTATNYRFQTLYAGTDIHGNKSPLTGYTSDGKMAPPDFSQPYYGPGFKLDNPSRAGNCATCHTPMSAKLPTSDGCSWSGCHSSTTAQYSDLIADGASPLYLYDDAAEGISCEFCHKIGDVTLNEATGLPYEDAPGILSLQLHRPVAGEDIFFGPVDDVVRTDIEIPRDSYLPLQAESAFCAGCHHGVMGGVVANMKVTGGVLIYSSYAEWLASPYSDPDTGQTCQDCHMPTTDSPYFVFPAKGGQARDHYGVSNHRMPGASDTQLLQNAVTLTGTAQLIDGKLRVAVSVTNDQTGHSMPTDSPLRNVLLIVQAKDANNRPLRLQSGPTLPDWSGNYAGQPGRYYAKILRDLWTGDVPTGAYWREIELVEDTRIVALATDASDYVFQAPADQMASVEIQLVYRRAYQQLMEWKDWPDMDIVMEQTTLTVQP